MSAILYKKKHDHDHVLYIPEKSCKLVVQSLVTLRLDYSNGLLNGIQ